MSHTIDVQTPGGVVKTKLLLGTDAVHGNQHVIGLNGIKLVSKSLGLISPSPQLLQFHIIINGEGKSSYNHFRFYETMGTDTDLIY